LLVEEQRNSRERIAGALSLFHDVILANEPGEALVAAREETIDLMIVSLASLAMAIPVRASRNCSSERAPREKADASFEATASGPTPFPYVNQARALR
jgi:hypothetical protein